MKRSLTLFLVAFLALGSGLVFAEEHGVDQEERDGLTGSLYRLSEIEDFGIMGQADDQIGGVDEAVLSLEGQVTHLIVDLDDTEGLEGGQYLVPLEFVSIYDAENITLDLEQAQEFQRYDDDPEADRAAHLPEGSIRSSELLGYDVYGPRDDRIAGTEDVVVDLETGEVVYVAISSGGFLGIGREYYAVSFDQLRIETAEERIWLDVTEDQLEQLEGFDTDNWPTEGHAVAAVETPEEEEPVAVETPETDVEDERDGLTGSLYRLSEIENFGIMGHADEQIGGVEEAVLSLQGEVTHLIVDLDDIEGVEGGRYLVPLELVSIYDTENIALDLQQAQDFARFDDDPAVWDDDDDPEAERAGQLPEGTVRSSDFLGYDVVGRDGETIASTEDVVVDLETGQIVYVAIASGGFLGIGRDYYAVSFDQLQIETAEREVRVDLTEEDLDQMEGFDTDDWPREGHAVGAML